MTALPAATDFTGAAITQGEFKTAVTNLRAFLAGLMGADGTVATALDTLSTLLSAGVVAKSAAYTVAASDRGVLLNCTGTWTLTLLAAATAGDGFCFAVHNSGTGTITIDPNAAETIDGVATVTIGAGLSAIIVCTGAAWLTAAKSADPYVEPTLSTGSTIYRQEAAEVQHTLTNGSYNATLGAGSSSGAIAHWLETNGNMMATRVDHDGDVTVSLDIKKADLDASYVRVVVNGTQQDQWSTGSSYSTKTKNVSVTAGDIVAVQARKDSGDSDAFVKNFKLLVDTLP